MGVFLQEKSGTSGLAAVVYPEPFLAQVVGLHDATKGEGEDTIAHGTVPENAAPFNGV